MKRFKLRKLLCNDEMKIKNAAMIAAFFRFADGLIF